MLGKNKYKLINYPKHYPADEPKRRCPDISKIKHTKYRPIVSVSEGISEHWIIIILVRKNNSKISIVLFAFGFMGNSTFKLNQSDNFSIKGLILPKKYAIFWKYKNKFKKKLKLLFR